jgi:hypothetical protein
MQLFFEYLHLNELKFEEEEEPIENKNIKNDL